MSNDVASQKRTAVAEITALRMAANPLMHSRTYLAAQYRRLRTKLGAPKSHHGVLCQMLKYGQR